MGRHLLWLTAVVAACATEHAPSSDDPADGETHWYVLSWLDVAAPDPAGVRWRRCI